MIWKIPRYGKWHTITTEALRDMRNKGEKEKAEQLETLVFDYEKNRLAYFLPHGVPHRRVEVSVADGEVIYPACTYPKEWLNDGVAFLNDWTNTIGIVLAGNQQGKSSLAVIKTALHVIPCHPEWPIFTEHHVQYHEWTGPKTWIVASYSWDNVKTLWERIRYFFPREQLLNYSPEWGKYEGEKGMAKSLTFGDGKPKDLPLACKSLIKFLCYTQQQMHWEGFTSHGITADEQMPYEKFVGWARSTITTGDYTPCFMALTGHVLDDRPDTGKTGWIYNDLWTGQNPHGRTIGRYMLSVESTPDAIISAVKKEELKRQWISPDVERSEKQKRAAIARYWGGWESGSGMVFDEWDRSRHVINPLFKDDDVPRAWTKWRVIDFGDSNISCCVWIAVAPNGTAFCYRCLYERGLSIASLAKAVIERSHNMQVEVGSLVDEESGATYKLYEEQQIHEQFYSSIIDSRSAAQQKMGSTLINIFQRYGLELSPSNGQKNSIAIPRLKEWLRLDYTREHISRKNVDGTPQMGAPRMYFFDGRCENGIREIESLALDPEDPGKIALHQADHFCDVLKYACGDNLGYYGDFIEPTGPEHEFAESGNVDSTTGY